MTQTPTIVDYPHVISWDIAAPNGDKSLIRVELEHYTALLEENRQLKEQLQERGDMKKVEPKRLDIMSLLGEKTQLFNIPPNSYFVQVDTWFNPPRFIFFRVDPDRKPEGNIVPINGYGLIQDYHNNLDLGRCSISRMDGRNIVYPITYEHLQSIEKKEEINE